MIKVFGHKSPDTDATGSPIIWAWDLSEIAGTPATPDFEGSSSYASGNDPSIAAGFLITLLLACPTGCLKYVLTTRR